MEEQKARKEKNKRRTESPVKKLLNQKFCESKSEENTNCSLFAGGKRQGDTQKNSTAEARWKTGAF